MLAGRLPVERLAAMRLIVTPGNVIDAQVEAERERKEDGDDEGTSGVNAGRQRARSSKRSVNYEGNQKLGIRTGSSGRASRRPV